MKWLKRIFGVKEDREKQENPVEKNEGVSSSSNQSAPSPQVTKEHSCFYCKHPIYDGEKWSKQQGNWFHRKCYKEVLKGL